MIEEVTTELTAKELCYVFQREVLREMVAQDMVSEDLAERMDWAGSTIRRWAACESTPFLARFAEMMRECGYTKFSLKLYLD